MEKAHDVVCCMSEHLSQPQMYPLEGKKIRSGLVGCLSEKDMQQPQEQNSAAFLALPRPRPILSYIGYPRPKV